MSEHELAVFVSAFETSGFTGSINWYRNLDRNWHLLADVDPIVHAPALMIRGERDMIPKFERLAEFVPNVDEISLDCGHWIQQELPDETTHTILNWLEQRAGAWSQPPRRGRAAGPGRNPARRQRGGSLASGGSTGFEPATFGL